MNGNKNSPDGRTGGAQNRSETEILTANLTVGHRCLEDRSSEHRERDSERIQFLGKSRSPDEYEDACSNLRAFFSLLLTWKRGDK